ncbi:MAG: D-glycero-beta-D-manno-heptose 1-phosphate adenylyltransferase [Bacteroidetes bacterium 4572_112]|nr:MAG: D-glycero-beta-D-manno-heptose 1-phosphate adenylyltransferase [Bacteroidetes bacterium 4572_112]
MSNYSSIKAKIVDNESLMSLINTWKSNGEKIVFTNGCFDIIHQGHIDYLAKASDLGSKLIIGVNTDRSVSAIKGKHRPIQDEYSRLMILAAMQFVDALILFDEDTPIDLITKIVPNVLVKGSDYKAENIVGYKVVTENGGRVETLDFLEGYSTSGIENKIILSNTK